MAVQDNPLTDITKMECVLSFIKADIVYRTLAASVPQPLPKDPGTGGDFNDFD